MSHEFSASTEKKMRDAARQCSDMSRVSRRKSTGTRRRAHGFVAGKIRVRMVGTFCSLDNV